MAPILMAAVAIGGVARPFLPTELGGGFGHYRDVVRSIDDKVVEFAGQGRDTVYTTKDFALADGVHVEQIIASGSGNLSLVGNDLSQRIIGNAGDNIINGGAGGNVLQGGGGNDSFVFNTTLGGVNKDYILDFSVAADCFFLDAAVFAGLTTRLVSGMLAPSAFHIGNAPANPSHRIIYNYRNGGLYFDADGSGPAAMVQFARVSPKLPMTYQEFYVF